MMLTSHFSAWLALPLVLLILAGSLITLIGCIGLVRLPYFYQRIHGPAISITFGTICLVLAALLYFSLEAQTVQPYPLLIWCFVLLTAPVSTMLVMRAAVYRDLRNSNKRHTENLQQSAQAAQSRNEGS